MHCRFDCLDYFCSFLLAKVRRLYDIANVLTSLCLIKKVHVTEERGRKPAFKWIGPVDFPGKTGKLWSSFHFSFDVHFQITKGCFLQVKNDLTFINCGVVINHLPAQNLPSPSLPNDH